MWPSCFRNCTILKAVFDFKMGSKTSRLQQHILENFQTKLSKIHKKKLKIFIDDEEVSSKIKTNDTEQI